MANIKFSAFTQLAPIDQTNSYIVGYEDDANTNNRWTFGEVALGLKAVTATPYSIYSASGALEATREVTLAGFDLTFVATGTGKIIYTDGNQAAGYALRSDASGKASWGVLSVAGGGTGQTSYTNGQLLIGNTTGNTLTKATLTAGTGVTVTNGAGSITIANSAPDQTVALTGGTGISTSGTYPNFTITNDSPNQATPAAGSSGQLQYNNGSNGFAATSDMVYTTDQLKVQNSIYLDGNGASAGSGSAGIVKLGCELAGASHYVGLEGPNHSGNTQYNIKFPDATPSANKMLIANSMTGTTANMAWRDMYDANGTLTAIRTVTMGAHNLTFASTTAGQEVKFQKNVRIDGQSYTPLETISSTASWTPDWDSGNVQTMELTAATTINNPSNIEVGATYIIILKQDGDGSHTVTWGNAYNFPGATAPTLTTGANKADVITLVAYSSTVLMCTSVLDFETT